jgi:hypothetical protein
MEKKLKMWITPKDVGAMNWIKTQDKEKSYNPDSGDEEERLKKEMMKMVIEKKLGKDIEGMNFSGSKSMLMQESDDDEDEGKTSTMDEMNKLMIERKIQKKLKDALQNF